MPFTAKLEENANCSFGRVESMTQGYQPFKATEFKSLVKTEWPRDVFKDWVLASCGGRFGVSHTQSWNCRDHHYPRSLQHDGKAPARRNRCYVANNLKFVFFTALMSDSGLDAKSGCEFVLGRSAELKRCLFPSSFQVSGFWHSEICNVKWIRKLDSAENFTASRTVLNLRFN